MSQLRTNDILDASGGTTATFNGIPLRPGVLDAENRIINGAFDFWQRGTSFTGNAYGADRWINVTNAGTVTMSRQAFTIGDTLGSNNPTFFLRQVVSGQTTAGSVVTVAQRIEGVRSYSGQTITILGWARRSSGSGNMAVSLDQNFGTGGSPSTAVNGIGPVTVTLTSSFAPFAVTIAVPSITGKTLGSNGNDYLQVNFYTSAGSDFNTASNSLGLQTIGVDLWGIHIKQGTHTTSAVDLYRQPELGPELARCQRYFENVALSVGPSGYLGMGMMWTTTEGRLVIPYKVQKRAAPTNTATGTLKFGDGTGIGTMTSFTFDSPSVSSVLLFGSFSSGSGTQGRACQVYVLSSDSFTFSASAEL